MSNLIACNSEMSRFLAMDSQPMPIKFKGYGLSSQKSQIFNILILTPSFSKIGWILIPIFFLFIFYFLSDACVPYNEGEVMKSVVFLHTSAFSSFFLSKARASYVTRNKHYVMFAQMCAQSEGFSLSIWWRWSCQINWLKCNAPTLPMFNAFFQEPNLVINLSWRI